MTRQEIDGIMYDTASAKKLAGFDTGLETDHPMYEERGMYLTPDKRIFKHSLGGGLSHVGFQVPGGWHDGEQIKPLTPFAAMKYANKWQKNTWITSKQFREIVDICLELRQ